MALPVNRPETIDKLVMTAFSNKVDLSKFLVPLAKLTFSNELKEKIDAHLEQEVELIKEITETIQKKHNLNYFVVMPTDKESAKIFKTDKGFPLFSGNDENQMVYGYAEPPQIVDDSPEMIDKAIRKHCYKHFDIPKDYRLTDREIKIILDDEMPSLTFDDVLVQRVSNFAAVDALREQIPSFDDEDAHNQLEAYASSIDFQKPFLDVKYPVNVNVPLVINRSKEEAYIQCVDAVTLFKAINLSSKELYSLAIQSTQKEPCLTFLSEASIDYLIDNGNNRYSDTFVPDSLTFPEGTHFGVWDPEVALPSSFGRTLSKPISLPEESCFMRADIAGGSARKRCYVPDEFFRPEGLESSNNVKISSLEDLRNTVSAFADSRNNDAIVDSSSGPWEMHAVKYYPELWRISYNEKPVVVRYPNGCLERVANISDKDFGKIFNEVSKCFESCLMAPHEVEKIQGKKNSHSR